MIGVLFALTFREYKQIQYRQKLKLQSRDKQNHCGYQLNSGFLYIKRTKCTNHMLPVSFKTNIPQRNTETMKITSVITCESPLLTNQEIN